MRIRGVPVPLGRLASLPVRCYPARTCRNRISKATKTPGQGHSFIESALRTLDAEAGGISALAAAIHDGLGRSFIAAVELIRAAKGRVIVTGMGKSGHVARKIAATFASTGTPAFFVHPERSEPRRSRHDHDRRRHHGAVLVGGNHRAQGPDRLFAAVPDRPPRCHRRRIEHARQVSRRRAGAAAGPRSLPAQSRADHVVADAARRSAMRSPLRCWKAAASPRSISACCIPAAGSARC